MDMAEKTIKETNTQQQNQMKTKRKTHINSTKAYYEIADKLPSSRREVFVALLQAYDAQTDRGIKDILRLQDMNQVRPRVTELIKQGLVEEVGSEICFVTGKRVRLVTTPFSHCYSKYKGGN